MPSIRSRRLRRFKECSRATAIRRQQDIKNQNMLNEIVKTSVLQTLNETNKLILNKISGGDLIPAQYKTKKVVFSAMIKIVFIPRMFNYDDETKSRIWWTKKDYTEFLKDYMETSG